MGDSGESESESESAMTPITKGTCTTSRDCRHLGACTPQNRRRGLGKQSGSRGGVLFLAAGLRWCTAGCTVSMLHAACCMLQDVVRALRSEKEALTTAGASVCDSGEGRVGKPVG